jgi:hypothetical protein
VPCRCVSAACCGVSMCPRHQMITALMLQHKTSKKYKGGKQFCLNPLLFWLSVVWFSSDLWASLDDCFCQTSSCLLPLVFSMLTHKPSYGIDFSLTSVKLIVAGAQDSRPLCAAKPWSDVVYGSSWGVRLLLCICWLHVMSTCSAPWSPLMLRFSLAYASFIPGTFPSTRLYPMHQFLDMEYQSFATKSVTNSIGV